MGIRYLYNRPGGDRIATVESLSDGYATTFYTSIPGAVCAHDHGRALDSYTAIAGEAFVRAQGSAMGWVDSGALPPALAI